MTNFSTWGLAEDKIYTNAFENQLHQSLSDYWTKSETSSAVQISTSLTAFEMLSNKVSAVSSDSTDDQYPTAKCLYTIAGTVDEILSAINGSSDWPDMTIFATKVPDGVSGNLAALDLNGNLADSGIAISGLTAEIAGKQDLSNLVSSMTSSSTDIQYPSAKCVYGVMGDAEAALDAILCGTTVPDLTIFATKANPSVSGDLAALDLSGNIYDSGMKAGDFAQVSNLVSSVTSASTDREFPTAKCVYDTVGEVENVLSLIMGDETWPVLSVYATRSEVSAIIGDINSVLDTINGEVI